MSSLHTKTTRYKEHLICSEARPTEGGGWSPAIQVSWKENVTARVIAWLGKEKFLTTEEAETEGIRLAKKWIDDGKPKE